MGGDKRGQAVVSVVRWAGQGPSCCMQGTDCLGVSLGHLWACDSSTGMEPAGLKPRNSDNLYKAWNQIRGFLRDRCAWAWQWPRKVQCHQARRPLLAWGHGATHWVFSRVWIVRMSNWEEYTAKIGGLGMLPSLHQLLSLFFELVTRTFLIVWSYLKSGL